MIGIEKWFLSVIKKPDRKILHSFLWLLSQGYRGAVFVRNCLFDLNIISSFHAQKKVVSIGNIVAGGTGKTSLTELIAQEIHRPVAILERGYRARKKRREPFLVSLPEEGDEAFLLAQKLPFAKVIIGKKRKESAKLADVLDVDYILLDDGMQHRYLHRDIEIVVLHYRDLFGGHAYLPRGLLRDSPKRLKKADYVVVNGVYTEQEFRAIPITTPLIGVFYEILNKGELQNRKVGAFCGIGKPEEFYALLQSIGCEIVEKKSFPDHSYFEGLEAFVQIASQKGAETIVCTEKDYVKLKATRGITPLKVKLEVKFGKEHFAQLKETIWQLL